jgi:hypothetical protein
MTTKEQSRRCKIHGISYTVYVSDSGKHLSGHCPICLESEDRDWDTEIRAFEKEIQQLENSLEKARNFIRFEFVKGRMGLFFWAAALLVLLPICAVLAVSFWTWIYQTDWLVGFIYTYPSFVLILLSIRMMMRVWGMIQFRRYEIQIEQLKKQKEKTLQEKSKRFAS